MLTRLEELGGRMLNLLMPRVDASAAAECTCTECVQGSGCSSTKGRYYHSAPCGSSNWVFVRCANCAPGSGSCI
ncbi:hypothetical protein AB0G32_27020 [Streptomyces sp. NPDC023723]|uniref:hypothetical protein n=1 Tax=Streptomyces sp. NPDC023723 TaxID=3154323 RepID=UPI0033FB414D